MGILLAILGVVVQIKSLTVHSADGEPFARTPWTFLLYVRNSYWQSVLGIDQPVSL